MSANNPMTAAVKATFDTDNRARLTEKPGVTFVTITEPNQRARPMPRFPFYVALLSLLAMGAQGQNMSLPDQESEFCSIAENANSAYGALARERSVAEKQQNGIRVQQIEQQMTSVYHKRNDDIFRLVKQKRFSADNWVVTVVKINAPISGCHTNMPSCIFVDVHPLCSQITTVHAVTAATPIQIQFLAAKQQGDQLMMSGMFVEQFGGATAAASPVIPTLAEKFEGSFRESGSVQEPEYVVDVRQWR
jgi:hypothetical protein